MNRAKPLTWKCVFVGGVCVKYDWITRPIPKKRHNTLTDNVYNHYFKGQGNYTVGLFKYIVSDLYLYNNKKSATSVFVIPTSVLVISCKSVSLLQKP